MKAARFALLALACTLPLAAAAQWQWVDKDGRKVFSDKMPPPDIPPERILKGPKGQLQVMAPAAAAPVAATADPAAANAAAMPRPLGKDAKLEERKKQVAAAEADKKKAEDAKYAALRSENCTRAKSAKANYSSGARMTRVDDKGQTVYIDDNERAAEIRRMDEVIARDCAQ